MKRHLLIAFALVFSLSPVFAQRPSAGPARPGPDHSDIHRSLSALEGELVSLLDRKEQITNATEQRNEELRLLHIDRNKSQGKERDRADARIDALNNQSRTASVELSRIGISSERIRLEIDRLMRYDDHISSDGGKPNRAPAIRAINVLRTKREGPVRVTGQGVGFQDTTVYEVIFADGSRQNVESKTFEPQKP
jgi:hypothetical protein